MSNKVSIEFLESLCTHILGKESTVHHVLLEKIIDFETGKTQSNPVAPRAELLDVLCKALNNTADNLNIKMTLKAFRAEYLAEDPSLFPIQLRELQRCMMKVQGEMDLRKTSLVKQYKEAFKKHPFDSLPAVEKIAFGLKYGQKFSAKVYPKAMTPLMRSIYQFNNQFGHLAPKPLQYVEAPEQELDTEQVIVRAMKEYCEKYYAELLQEYNLQYSTNSNNIALLQLRGLKKDQIDRMKQIVPDITNADQYLKVFLGIESASLRATMLKLVAMEKVIAVANQDKAAIEDVQKVIEFNKEYLDMYRNKTGIKIIDDFIDSIKKMADYLGLWKPKTHYLQERLDSIARVGDRYIKPEEKRNSLESTGFSVDEYHSSPSTTFADDDGYQPQSSQSCEEGDEEIVPSSFRM